MTFGQTTRTEASISKERMKLSLHPENWLAKPHEFRHLAGMLIALHLGLWWDFGSGGSRALILAHLGLFLIWQPLLRVDERLKRGRVVVVVVAAVGFALWANLWLTAFWLLLLIGLVSGRLAERRSHRIAFMVALVFLVMELLIGVLPLLFRVHFLQEQLVVFVVNGIGAIPLLLFFVGSPRLGPVDDPPVLDFLYGITMSLLTTVLGLGALLSMYYAGSDYAGALLQVLAVIVAFLLAITWLWLPLAGFSGLGQLWTRYLLNVGTPFEAWLTQLAVSGEKEGLPQPFLAEAMRSLADLPWVAGVQYSVRGHQFLIGEATPFGFRLRQSELNTEVYTPRPIGTALLMHGKLLVQLVAFFYESKQRQQELAQRAHLQAIYETGARVTHDIKNLLQSLQTMSGAIEATEPASRREALEFLAGQMPTLTLRLKSALEKLATPQTDTIRSGIPVSEWWRKARQRYAGDDIRFSESFDQALLVPWELFDSVFDNLVENARTKRALDPSIRISVQLTSDQIGLRLRCCDSGFEPIPTTIAENLFKGPIRSKNGLGIGLFQAGRQAELEGYELVLKHNLRGNICFELRGAN